MESKPYTKISDTIWEIPTSYKKGMRVPARIIATEKLINAMEKEVFEQIANVATLPGLLKYVLCMPDGHVGYGCPIGGVGATDPASGGVISPGMIGFDINCGMRLLTTDLTANEVRPRIEQLVDRLFSRIPAGVGVSGFLKPSKQEFNNIVVKGASWAVANGFGRSDDLAHTEEHGAMANANPETISDRAIERGLTQLGTLGSGNHYLEAQVVDVIFDQGRANAWGIKAKDQVVVMFHCGSRGFGHQVASDYLRVFEKKMGTYGISVPDPQLAAAPFTSADGQRYYQAMAGACNVAFANRQVITHRIREVLWEVFGREIVLPLVYDVAHNIAKLEEYEGRKLVVHRKGATRAFENQPVILGGSMETGSYLLVGTKRAMDETFGSTAHGSGRTMSRSSAKKSVDGKALARAMRKRGIYVRSASWAGLAEEAGFAYKDIHEVVTALSQAGISEPVASFKPIGNVKG